MSLPPLPYPPQFTWIFSLEIQSSWDHLVTAPAVSRSMNALYRVHDVEKLGLAHFLLVETSIAALVQAPNFALLSEDAVCPNKQCQVSEVVLKRAYSASAFAAHLGNYNSILVDYQSHFLRSLSEHHRPSPQQLGELHLVNKHLLRVSKLNGQAVGTNLAALVAAGRQLWLSQTRVPDRDKAQLLEAPITPRHRRGAINPPPLDFKPALMFETFSINAVVMEKSISTPQNSTSALSFHDLNRRHYNTFHCNFTISCQSISQHVDVALVRLIHQFSTMIDDIKATQTDIKLSRYTAGSTSPTPNVKTRKHRDIRCSNFSRSSRGSHNGGSRGNNKKNYRAGNENNKKEPHNKNSVGRSERRISKLSRKGSKEAADHMTIQMDDSDSITVSEQSETSAECWQNMYKLLNFYSLISDPTGILEKTSPGLPTDGGRTSSESTCKVIFENELDRSLVSTEPQHVTLIVFGIGMVNRTHLEADIGGITMEADLTKIHGSFTLKEKMKDILHQKMMETCASAHIGGVNIVLLEGITPTIQTVVKCNIAKSQALYSAQRGLKTNNAAVFKVGTILIDIPQHPATLHSMMVRSSHQLSKQISDLIRQPSTMPQPPREDVSTPHSSEKTTSSVNQTPVEANEFPQLPEGLEKKPIVLKFSAMLDSITIVATHTNCELVDPYRTGTEVTDLVPNRDRGYQTDPVLKSPN
ncbi:UNVERIFIED_CONTAM: hypothetical protein FKN15_029771 [Acipenser sinensis]